MALDHCSAFTGYRVSGEDWFNNNPELQIEDWTHILYFITRFITSLCQMGFFFLMGIGMMYYWDSRVRADVPRPAIVKHFVIRGLVLIATSGVTEIVTFNLSGYFAAPSNYTWKLLFCVLDALGFSMIVCSLLLLLRDYVADKKRSFQIGKYSLDTGTLLLATISITIALCTNFNIHAMSPASVAHLNFFLAYFWVMGSVSPTVFVLDPVIPWVSVCLVGLLFGQLFVNYRHNEGYVYKVLACTGASLWALFGLLRVLGLAGVTYFGSFRLPVHDGSVQYANAFFSLTKYPPSISFICFYLGADMLILSLVYATDFPRFTRISQPALVFGKSSLFFYAVHLYVYLGLGRVFQRNLHSLDDLWAYPVWVTGLVLLYPLCSWYGDFKSTTDPSSLWRLF
eukprot:TRINITY_DN6162_c0_g1_i2.p1 TRINITY_DN6162_c0_g1~~TRINITY_DN6162_c0_g1_i2.p1  ORF type:complete len:447 (-),score=82.44 TRINITY_DN6162_c0_g1_i2:49-1239(-)